ncbi:MAG: NAD(P)-dependent malic enzyme [Deltaproteobacteria bacterium]
MNIYEEALIQHKKWQGKIEITSRAVIETIEDISIAYTPGVAEPCRQIAIDKDKAYDYTRKWNTVAIVTDGTAVLGLGDIGPEAGLPVMEGKAVLFKKFADIDAVPICLATKDSDEIVKTIVNIAPTFGGINIEDISAPRCFEIEKRLKEQLNIPVFHDDQHGTAIVILSALINSLKIIEKRRETVSIVINGAGAAAIATAKLLLKAGFKDIILCDTCGAIYEGRGNLNCEKEAISKITNLKKKIGKIKEVIKGTDIFIGLSAGGVLNAEAIAAMNSDAVVFALANPEPEIFPDEAERGGAKITGTGRSDFKNQINNALVFPGLFRGALDVRAREINYEMKIAAAEALAGCISEEELSDGLVIPQIFMPDLSYIVAEAVIKEARNTGAARS